MDFEEFDAVAGAWAKNRDDGFKNGWEQVRWLGAVTIQPHLKKGAVSRPRKILPLPWDGGGDGKKTAGGGRAPLPPAERSRKRFEELKSLYENK